jgi:hypothetical protein
MNKPTAIVIFLYNRLFDPLVQANFWLYIEDYLNSQDENVRFHIISYEDEKFPLTDIQKITLEKWRKQGLTWTPLKWHKGTGAKSKLIDLFSAAVQLIKFRIAKGKHTITYGSISSSYVYLIGKILGYKLFIHTFEPHSEYAIESGIWKSTDLMPRLLKSLEKKAAHFAICIASGTKYMEYRLKNEWRIKGKFFKIPSVANSEKFSFNDEVRKNTRIELGIKSDNLVLFYPGKFGDLYYKNEIAWMYRWLHEIEPRLHFLIVTPNSASEVSIMFKEAGVPEDAYTITHADYSIIHKYFFAADFAIIAVPFSPSKRFVSNIKVGEYLCSGLPYLITHGVSEDSVVAKEMKVGVVVNSFNQSDILAAWPEIKAFLDMDETQRRAHCRAVGLSYRGFTALNPIFKTAVNELIKCR